MILKSRQWKIVMDDFNNKKPEFHTNFLYTVYTVYNFSMIQ